jgi:DNA-binding PadR family transcriptional regulator
MAERSANARKAAAAAVAADQSAAEAVDASTGAKGRKAAPGGTDPLVGELRKAGLLSLLVLHEVAAGPSYGNQLIDRVSELTGGVVAANPNTMYPLLRTLEADGLLEGSWEHPERRSRRFYSITPAGQAERERLADELGPRLDSLALAIERIRAEVLSA